MAKPKRPKQKSLPGMEDSKIEELHKLGRKYAQIRDERMDLNEKEVELKADLKVEMKKQGKLVYRYDELEIRIIPGEDDVKVRVAKDKKQDKD